MAAAICNRRIRENTMLSADLTDHPPSVPILRVADLTKIYGDDAAIRDVGFSVMGGEILGILGPNGAGKTTLLEALVGLLPVDSGIVIWRGEELPAAQRRTALFYLPDGIRPYQDQHVADVVSFIADVYRRPAVETRTVVGTIGLLPVLQKRVRALSKGFARRLMLTLALLAPHPVLLMDEPFDGLDLRQTRDIIGVLRNEAGLGRTLLLAVHQLTDAEQVCDRFVLLAGGRVRGTGTLDELRTRTALPSGSLKDIFLALT